MSDRSERVERSISPDQSRQAFTPSTSWKNAGTDLRLTEQCTFPAGVTQIARQGQFVPAAPCPSTDGGNADERSFRQPQDEIDPYAVYGYEAMAVVCDSIAQGGDDRKAVIDAFLSTKGRESPLGVYDIDPDGDTTLSDYGGYTAEGGKLAFNKVIKAN